MTPLTRLDADVGVAAQLSTADLAAVADAGFRSVICNRPDGEESGQPTFAELEAAARAAGLEMVHQPVASGTIDDAAARAFEAHLETLPSPTLAFCRSGTRSASLWALAKAPSHGVADVLSAAKAAGYDLSVLLSRSTRTGASSTGDVQ